MDRDTPLEPMANKRGIHTLVLRMSLECSQRACGDPRIGSSTTLLGRSLGDRQTITVFKSTVAFCKLGEKPISDGNLIGFGLFAEEYSPF